MIRNYRFAKSMDTSTHTPAHRKWRMVRRSPRKRKEEYERIRAEMNPSIDFSKIGSRSYGGVYLMDQLQRRLKL